MQRSSTGLPRSRIVATLVAIAALTVAVAGCGSSSKSDDGASGTTTPSGPAPVTITAGDYKFEGVPETMTAGIQDVTFVNEGSTAHEMVFAKVTPGTTPKALNAAVAGVFDGAPWPKFVLEINGVPDTEAGKTTVTQFNLTAGDYIALCGDSGVAGSDKDGPPHFNRGMHAETTVTGEGGDTPPTAEASIVAKDYSFELNGLKAGEQTIAFTNDGPVQWHFGHIMGFPDGVSVAEATADFKKLLATDGPPPAGVSQPEEVALSQIASPGRGNTFTATLEAGRAYVVVCFVTDLKGGPPHAIGHQMFKVFTIA